MVIGDLTGMNNIWVREAIQGKQKRKCYRKILWTEWISNEKLSYTEEFIMRKLCKKVKHR